jgi:hypothetical protein
MTDLDDGHLGCLDDLHATHPGQALQRRCQLLQVAHRLLRLVRRRRLRERQRQNSICMSDQMLIKQEQVPVTSAYMGGAMLNRVKATGAHS